MDFEVEVYEAQNPSTPVGTLSGDPNNVSDGKSFNRGFLDQFGEVGSGTLSIHVDDPALGGLDTPFAVYGNIFRIKLGGMARFAWILENRARVLASAGEKAEDVWTWSGRGVLALLESAIVFPELVGDEEFGATLTQSTIRQRFFNWTAIQYNDSSWITATAIQRQGDSGPEQRWVGKPEGWPDPDAYWIWSRDRDADYPAGKMPPGVCYFRQSFTIDPEFDGNEVAFYATCDNAFQLFLDGEPLLEGTEWTTVESVKKRLSQGTHELAARCENTAIAAASAAAPAGPAGLLVTAFQLDELGNISDGVVQTNSAWKALDYPDAVPGMSIGEIMRILIEENQARGGLAGVTWNFSDTGDSQASSWLAGQPLGGVYTVDIAFDIGTSLLDVARTFHEQYADVYMTPQLVLEMHNKGTYGEDLTGSVSIQVGDVTPPQVIDLRIVGQNQLTNAILARDTTAALTLREDAASLSAHPRRETYMEVATAPGEESAQQMAGEVLVEFSLPTAQLSGEVTAEAGPYSVWKPGDTIRFPNLFGVATDTTVLSLAVEEDRDMGRIVYKPEGIQYDSGAT